MKPTGNKREGWSDWYNQLKVHLKNRRLAVAANLLVCCTRHDMDWTPADETGHKRMFEDPEVRANRDQLWKRMVPLITPNCRNRVLAEVREMGWAV